MIPTHFHLQDQPWQLHKNIGNLHVQQAHSTKSLPNVQISCQSKNSKQLQKFLPQYISHIVILYLHWCFRCQGDKLSANQTLQVAPAIELGGH